MGSRRWLRGKPSPEDAFADEVAGLVRRLLPGPRVERGDGFSLRFTTVDGEPVVLFLHNIFSEASQLDGPAREERLRRAVLAMRSSDRPATWAEAEARLMPALRTPSWAAAHAGGSVFPVRRVFAPFVLLLTAVDDEHSMSFVGEDDLRGWGVDGGLVERTALANLTREAVPTGGPPGEPWLEVLGPDGYASAWLAIPDALTLFAEPLGENFVALATSRDSLRLVATGDREVLRLQLAQALADYRAAPRQLSPVPYVVRGDRIEPWEPTDGDSCRAAVDLAQHVLAATEYGFQRNVLDDLFQKAGEDVFVAKLSLMEREDGSVWSWAAWVKQVTDGALPLADFLCLGDTEAGTSFWVRWEDAVDIAGPDLREEHGCYPPRWRVTGWPTGGAVAELQRLAVEPGRAR